MTSKVGATDRGWLLLLASWLIALVSTLGALFFSQIMELQPCVLCWYQRIAMFPLALILGIGVYAAEPNCVKYALPTALFGWMVALYHCLLYGGLIPQDMQPCDKSGSCSEQELQLVGFITIPLLSFLAFSIIVLLLLAAKKALKNGQ